MELELLAHKTGEVYLNRWDSINGKDRVFRLDEDGTAYEADFGEDGEAVYTLVDLVAELRALAISSGETA